MNVTLFADVAHAASAPPGGGAGPAAFVQPLILFGVMFAIFYFLMIRPQQRQRQDRERMLAALKRGDKVVTTSGLYGTITGINEHSVTLRVADQVKLEFERSAIGRIVEGQGDKDA
ncbi:MAG TPA: preprotein translocase subunit YajC [Methylomirabilota bacterium]|nr:preprotein translocase subunit YajC [Methylomirabilota bacterium]